VVQSDSDPREINARLLEQKIVGGLPLNRFYPELGNASLWCCTEMIGREDIQAAAQAVSQAKVVAR
jgi:glycine dehydrogenase subunit 1